MAEPNDGLVVDGIRLMVFDVDGPSGGPGTLWNVPLDLALASAVERRAAEVRVSDAETHELLASGRFRTRRAAERARDRLAGLVDEGHPADTIDWVGELAILT